MTIAGNRVLVSYGGQPTICYGCGVTVYLYLVCPRRRKVAPAKSTEPTTSWADIAARGYRSPRDDGGESEASAGQHSAQAGQGDGRHAEDRNAIQADNMQEPDVPSKPSKEPERKKPVRSDVTKKRIPFIFNDESTGSCICLRLDLYLSHVKTGARRLGSLCSILPFSHKKYPRQETVT
jgi:hypothetical protein